MYCLFAPCCNRTIRCDDLDKNEQGFARSKVSKNQVWQIFVWLNSKPDCFCYLFIAHDHLIAALAEPQHGRVL